MLTPGQLLNVLPPFVNDEVTVAPNQVVGDIIKEVLNAHEIFASDYDSIAVYFKVGAVSAICKSLFDFCKRNIAYKVEGEEDQTTRSPAAILAIGSGDCKHYAGFIAGVLDALKRDGLPVFWCYRFASYDLFNKTPGHVFVVVKGANGKEIWIDPVLAEFNERLQPSYQVDKKASVMLKRISGLEITDDPVYYPVSDYLNATAADTQAYASVQTLLKHGVMNLDLSINDDLIPALQDQLPASTFTAIQDARASVERMAISGLGENIAHAAAKVIMLVPRNAYLSLVGLNVFGLANKLWHAIYTDDTGSTYYQPGQDKIYHVWYRMGGDWDKLLNTVRHGKKNKAILGVAQIAIPAWVASATAIIAAVGKVLSDVLKTKSQATGVNYNVDPASGQQYGTPPGGGIVSFIEDNPLMAVGIVGALFLVLRKARTKT